MKHTLLFACLLFVGASSVEAQQDKSFSPESVVITPENPLPVKDSLQREAVVKWSIKQLKEKDYKKIKAHPSSDYFPGKVKEGYQFVDRTVNIQHKKISDSLVPIVSRLDYSSPWADNIYSTGLYAVPGEYIEITIPKSLKNKDISVQIGSQSDQLNEWVAATEAWRRMPIIVRKDELKNEITRIASPFGGLIYITASPKMDNWSGEIFDQTCYNGSLLSVGSYQC